MTHCFLLCIIKLSTLQLLFQNMILLQRNVIYVCLCVKLNILNLLKLKINSIHRL